MEAYAESKGYPDECSFSAVLQQFALEAQQEELYTLCNQEGLLTLAEALDDVESLLLQERLTFCTAPVDTGKPPVFAAFRDMVARCARARLSLHHGG